MKKEIIVLLFALSNITGMSYSQELVGTKITIKDAWDNVFRSVDQGRNYELIGTYQGWNKDAIYIAGYNNQNYPSYYSTKYVSFGGAGVERLWVDLLSGNVGIGTTTPASKLDLVDNNQHLAFLLNQKLTGNWPGTTEATTMTIQSSGISAGNLAFATGNSEVMRITASSFVGIGTANPAYKLDVLGTIHAKEVLVNLDGGADFVFEKDYKLLPIEHVANYVQKNKHLPDIPSANEMVKNGVSMGDMQVKLLQKVEELTLYAIQQNKKITEQDMKNKELELELQALKKIVAGDIAKRK